MIDLALKHKKLRPIPAAVVLSIVFIGLCQANFSSAAAPTLTHVFPAGGQRGTKVAVKCTGTFTWPVKVDAPGVDVTPGKKSGELEISIPADLSTDGVWLRLYNAEGCSAAVPFLVCNLKELEEVEPNNSLRKAQKIADPHVIINGVLLDKDVDCFAVQLDAGQTLVASLDANGRLGSPMDAILQVVSPDGIVLAENHDDVGLDPQMAFTAVKAGTYIVRLFAFPAKPDSTIALHGSAEYVYRLTLTTGPFIMHSVPLAVAAKDPGDVEVFGWNIPASTRRSVVPLAGTGSSSHAEFAVSNEHRSMTEPNVGIVTTADFAGAARVRITSHDVERELAKSTADAPQELHIPTAVTGWLKAPRQKDYFRLPLKKGDRLSITIESKSLGLSATPVVQLLDPAGQTVADVADPGPTQEIALNHTATQDGSYKLIVADRFRLGGERALYRLTIHLDEPDFELQAAAESIVVTPDKAVELPITVQRRSGAAGSVGPIKIEILGLPDDVVAKTVVSEPKGATANKVSLSLTTAGAGFSGPIKIVGTATQPAEIKRVARTAPRLGATFDTIWLTAIAKPESAKP